MNKKVFNPLVGEYTSRASGNGSLCSGRANCSAAAEELHSCPFKIEIHDDEETLCDCCEDCEHECAMEI